MWADLIDHAYQHSLSGNMVEAVQTKPALQEALNCPSVDLDHIASLIRSDPLSLHIPNDQGLFPIQVAAQRGHSGLIRVLAGHGADLTVENSRKQTPFLIACQSGSLYAVNTIVECGADTNVIDENGRNGILLSTLVGAVHIVIYLHVKCGMSLQVQDFEGYTALHLAVWQRHLEAVTYLLRRRCDPTVRNIHGTTPLSIAAKLGSRALAWLLIHSTKENQLISRDSNNLTPLDHAQSGPTPRHTQLAKKMEQWTYYQIHQRRKWLLPQNLLWLFFLVAPGMGLALANYAFCKILFPVNFIGGLLLVAAGFFGPLYPHRIPHDSGLPNPGGFGGMVYGLLSTLICYLVVVSPRLWPGNMIWFIVLGLDFIAIVWFLWKLETRDPGYDSVGRIGLNKEPMTIIDIACQSREAVLQYSFCSNCEIVLPDRTKHCKLCERCCGGFDHHCMWLMSCIGRGNHRLFVVFLFLLFFDNFLFVKEGISCLIASQSQDAFDPMSLFWHGLNEERWLFFMMVCNVLTGLFGLVNFVFQLTMVSGMETTYFDYQGNAAYKMPRKRSVSLASRIKSLWLFFTNYERWFQQTALPQELTRRLV